MYEVFLLQRVVDGGEWRKFLGCLMRFLGQGERAELIFNFDDGVVRIFLKTRRRLPYFLVGAEEFVINETDYSGREIRNMKFATFVARQEDSLMTVAEKMSARGEELKEAQITVRKIGTTFNLKTYLVAERGGCYKMVRLFGAGRLLDLDFRKNYLLRKVPKYLNMAKAMQFLSSDDAGAVLELNTYPYLNGEHYLSLKNYDFYKHAVVFGASGSGKSKFLSSWIWQMMDKYGDKYHFLVIDPHDAMREEIGGMAEVKVFDFMTKEKGLNLFLDGTQDIISSVDMALGLVKTLTGGNWNMRAERLLRNCLYLLIEKGELDFQNLRRLLTDVTYKNACLEAVREYLPESLLEFFGQDYNELKTQYYDVSFGLVVSLIDELQLTPAFYRSSECRLDFELAKNKVTLVSLNQAKLGEKPVKMLAGLMMNQLFMLGVQRKLGEHIVLVVDEVAVVESPILIRFLAEARKYNITVVLAGQYFAQISDDLKTAIYANVANYFCFRLNYDDAEKLAGYLDLELANTSQDDFKKAGRSTYVSQTSGGFERERVKLLTTLADRRIVVRLSKNGVLGSAMIGESLDFVAKPELRVGRMTKELVGADAKAVGKKLSFKAAKSSIIDLMREQSTSRRKVN